MFLHTHTHTPKKTKKQKNPSLELTAKDLEAGVKYF